jgi:hypothetical protein
MSEKLINFVYNNSSSNINNKYLKKFKDTIDKLSIWSFDNSNRNEDIKISNDNMYTVTNFYKMFIENFTIVFPNIILNKVNYNNTHIPSYYGFSKNHSNKLKKYIEEYFEKLKPFYGIPTLLNVLNKIQNNTKNLLKFSKNTPCFSSIKIGDKVFKGIIDERVSRFLFKYYLLRILINYIELSEDSDMIVREIKEKTEITDIYSVDYIDETETIIDLDITSRNKTDTRILTGNKKELKQKVCELLVEFINIFRNEKEIIDTSYEDIQDKVFKLREREKDMVTDRLKSMTDEDRDVDTILKITKQGEYSKGLQKGLTIYDKDFYEEEQYLRDEMEKAERKIRGKNKDISDENIDMLIDDYLEQKTIDAEIDKDAYDMEYLNETFYDGNFDGIEAPEEEYEDYTDFD